jgi:hypothetical protein
VTTRRSEDLPPPLPANVRLFPNIIGPEVVLEMALRQRETYFVRGVERRLGQTLRRIMRKLFR